MRLSTLNPPKYAVYIYGTVQAQTKNICIFPITSTAQCISVVQMLSLEKASVIQLKGCFTTSRYTFVMLFEDHYSCLMHINT